MTNKMFDSFGAVKNALEKAKDTAVGKATEALDANNDGTVDIQDIIILAIKLPGVHVTRESFLRNRVFHRRNHRVRRLIAHLFIQNLEII